jgi:hypothetical protein
MTNEEREILEDEFYSDNNKYVYVNGEIDLSTEKIESNNIKKDFMEFSKQMLRGC